MKEKSETEIQSDICTYLDELKQKGVLAYSVTNAGRNIRRRHSNKRDIPPGWPDIVGLHISRCHDGKFFGIEVKSKEGKQSIDQIIIQRLIETLGGFYILARCVNDVAKILL
jgi:hypothetical protein